MNEHWLIDAQFRKWIALHNFLVRGFDDSSKIKIFTMKLLDPSTGQLRLEANHSQRVKQQIQNMLEFYFVGVSLGLAYAHPHSGDTVASVMIGGLRTVLNGHFQVFSLEFS